MVDLPGYGYAAVPGRVRSTWPAMIEGYLVERANLNMIMALIDAEVGPTALDMQMLEWLRFNELPFTIVATKHDKVRATKRPRRKAELTAGVGHAPVMWVSAAKGTGIEELRAAVTRWLAL